MAGRLLVGKEMESGVVVATHGEWKLYARCSHGRWIPLKVVCMQPTPKANYRSFLDSVSGKLTRSYDMRMLEEHELHVYRWVIAQVNDPNTVAAIMRSAFPAGNNGAQHGKR